MSPARAYGRRPDAYRLPAAARLGPVRLQVADLRRSLAFYRDTLGFDARERVAEDGARWAELRGADGTTVLALHERRGARPVPQQGRLGLFHVAVLLPTRADLGRFLTHALRVGSRPGAADHAVSEALYLTDPDGLGLEIYADRPRDAWRVDGAELHLTTEPLDAHGLVAAGGDAAWTGMPAGTRVGHVHLHVGDVGEALRFYHQGLGFDQTVWRYPGAAFLGAGGYHHHVAVNVWAPDAAPAGDGDARLLEWTLELPDATALDAFCAGARAAGLTVHADGATVRLRDPWGTAVRVTATAAVG